jgi:hypothetical protein
MNMKNEPYFQKHTKAIRINKMNSKYAQHILYMGHIYDNMEDKVIICHAMKMYWVSRGTAPSILNLSTRWRSVVSFTPSHSTPG